jgi:predicted secreted hydrolase
MSSKGIVERWGSQGVFVAALSLVVFMTSVAVGESAHRFTPATPGSVITLPSDHGVHPEYETEWWYYTGHLVPEGQDLFSSDRRYGFQLTFFRRGVASDDGAVAQIYLAHAAFSDIGAGRFVSDSRLAPERLGFARAARGRLDVRNLDWSAELIAGEHLLRFSLPALAPELEFRFLGADAPAILNGEGGFSRKSGCSSCASMYYSVPRIEIRGHIVDRGTPISVRGIAWMDHEYMSNALESHQVGWDWVSLMFKDGTDLMLFRIRTADGSPPFLSGTVRRAGVTQSLRADQIEMTPLGEPWKSPRSGGAYPTAFRLKVADFGINTTIRSLMPDQEVAAKGEDGIAYYEGAVRSDDREALGYLEMTGYAEPLGNRL